LRSIQKALGSKPRVA